MDLDQTELLLLTALLRASSECNHPMSVVTLRYALLQTHHWDAAIEFALCNGGDEEPIVARYYSALCRLACDTSYADGAGDLRSPAGPRYTACWITQAGSDLLDQSS